MLKIEGKTFMNIQEAVQWLLDNNALPFQSSANYQANTEIGLGTIANPSPAKVRIGSMILFADSKIGTVSGLTDSGFMVGSQYVDIKNALNYISNIEVNASGYLITTFSDGSTKNAGLLKQVSSFSIDASQHLIVNYNNGTSEDLGSLGNYTNVDFKAKTLEQTLANWKGDNINFNAPAGLTITNTYNRLEVINQILHCVVNFKIENHSGSAKSFEGVDLATTLPLEYAQQVIDVNGDSVADNVGTDYQFITGEPCYAQKNSSSYEGTRYPARLFLCNRTTSQFIQVFVFLDTPVSLDDGDYLFVTGRIALTLI